MSRRAKLTLATQPAASPKTSPALDEEMHSQDADLSPAPVRAANVTRWATILVVVAIGALCLYVLRQRR